MEHDGCKGCRYEKENEYSIHCQGCKQNVVDKYVKKTNADRIREMTNEELAELMASGEWSAICPFCKYYGTENCYVENKGASKNCADGIKEWLESECDVE